MCNYIDMPLQHISDHMLTAMNREISRKETEQLLKKVRRAIPDLTFRTTFLVGFPGENEDDFQQLYDFVSESAFDRVGVFPYSAEEHTPAAKHPDQVPEEVKQERFDQLMELQRGISLARNQALIGKTLKVLIDEPGRVDAPAIARTEADAPEVDNEVLIYDTQVEQGAFLHARVVDALEYDLVGEVAHPENAALQIIEPSNPGML